MLMRHFKQRLTFLFTESYTTLKSAVMWRGATLTLSFRVFSPLLLSTLGRHSNSLYRTRRVMLMSACPVKNTFAVEKHFGSCLGS